MQNDATKKTKLAPKIALAVGALLIVISAIFFATSSRYGVFNLLVNNNTLKVEIATTSQEQQKGLCCRDTLAENSGMLFVYDTPGLHYYWMKDTRIPLDMYWLNTQKEIIHIEKNVQPSSYPKSFGPNQPSLYVLETNAGYADSHGITVGQVVQFNLKSKRLSH